MKSRGDSRLRGNDEEGAGYDRRGCGTGREEVWDMT